MNISLTLLHIWPLFSVCRGELLSCNNAYDLSSVCKGELLPHTTAYMTSFLCVEVNFSLTLLHMTSFYWYRYGYFTWVHMTSSSVCRGDLLLHGMWPLALCVEVNFIYMVCDLPLYLQRWAPVTWWFWLISLCTDFYKQEYWPNCFSKLNICRDKIMLFASQLFPVFNNYHFLILSIYHIHPLCI